LFKALYYEGLRTLSDAVCLSICLSVTVRQKRCISGMWLLPNTNGKPHVEVEPTGQHDPMTTELAETALTLKDLRPRCCRNEDC